LPFNIVLINPSFNRYAGIKGHGGLSAPLNLALLAAYLRQKRPDTVVSIIDAEAFGYGYDETVNEVRIRQANLIGITTTTPSFDVVSQLVSKLHDALPMVPVILGGPHATGSPETTLNVQGVTAAVLGEGEETFVELVNAIESGSPITHIKGLAYKGSGGDVQTTPLREPIQDLDRLPLPARDLLPMELYHSPPTKSLGGRRIANVVTSRGCPFRCTYCLSHMMWPGRVRSRSVDKIIEEIEECIHLYRCDEINFNDDLFTADKTRLMEFCEKIIKRGIKIHWVAMSRSDYISSDLLKLMKQAGCGKIAMGLESGSADVLKCMNKRLDLDKSIEAVNLIKQSGIRVGISFVLGHIGETKETIKETIQFAQKLNPDTVAFFQASPYPGTE